MLSGRSFPWYGQIPGAGRRPVRAALISPGLALGGAERWLVSLVRYSLPSALKWTGVAISSAGGTDFDLCHELSKLTRLHCQQLPATRNPQRPFHLDLFHHVHADWTAAVRAACADADVIVAWGAVSHVGDWVSHLTIPSVVVSHTTEQEAPAKCIHSVTHLAAVSEAAASYFDGREGRDLYDDVRILHNGADRRRCLPKQGRQWQRTQWGLSREDIAVGYIGRESPEKNFLATALAVNQLQGPFRAIYHGALVQRPTEHDPELQQLADIDPQRIILRQPVADVGDVLAGLDVMVLASHREAFSLSLIEAWLAGVPVVATPVGSIPELQNRFGEDLVIQVPINPSPQVLAEAIRRAAGIKGREIATRTKAIAEANFTCEAMAENWTEYLTQIVRESRRQKRPKAVNGRTVHRLQASESRD